MQAKSSSIVHEPPGARAWPPLGALPLVEGRMALDRFPGVVFQIFRSVDGKWTVPFSGHDLPRIFSTTAAALAEDAGVAARHVPQDDLERLKQCFRDSLDAGQTFKTRFRVRPAELPERWLEVTAAPELAYSGGTLWHGFLVDVTTEQQSNRELRELHRRWTRAARAAGIGVLEFDRASATLGFDALACAHHGIAAEQTWLDLQSWLGLVAPEDRLVAHTAFSSMPVVGFADCLVLRVDAARPGDRRTLEFTFQATTEDDRLVGTCRDVTQRQTLEALRSEKLAAEKASRAKSEFMSRVSHELRTPLNGILGFVQLMAQDRQHPLPPAQRRRLDVLQQSGTRLLALIDQLLDVSRIEHGRVPLRLEALRAGPLIDGCVAAVFALAQSRGVQVTTEVAPDALPIRADAQAFEQVLSTLLANAVKYNRPNGRVRVRFTTGETGRLIVDDTGVGMSESQLAMLFEPFNRLGAERTPIAGSGLGLVIVKKLLQAMGGALEVQSRVGRGSRFEARFAVAEPEPVDRLPPPPAMAAPRSRDGERVVLYVEDDEVNTLLMEQVFLGQPAWRLVTAATGAEGLRLAAERRPEVVLLDLHLPDMSGLDVLEALRADRRTARIPCIAVSADVRGGQIEDALRRGFDHYWTKPLDLAAVARDLLALLEREDEAV